MPQIGQKIDFQGHKFIILDTKSSENEVLLGQITEFWTKFCHFLTGKQLGEWHTYDPGAMKDE